MYLDGIGGRFPSFVSNFWSPFPFVVCLLSSRDGRETCKGIWGPTAVRLLTPALAGWLVLWADRGGGAWGSFELEVSSGCGQGHVVESSLVTYLWGGCGNGPEIRNESALAHAPVNTQMLKRPRSPSRHEEQSGEHTADGFALPK